MVLQSSVRSLLAGGSGLLVVGAVECRFDVERRFEAPMPLPLAFDASS